MHLISRVYWQSMTELLPDLYWVFRFAFSPFSLCAVELGYARPNWASEKLQLTWATHYLSA